MPRLTPDERKAIFDAYEAGGCTQYDLAAEYGVTQGAIYLIVKGTNRARARERRLKLRGAFVEHVDFASVVERDNNICGICNQFVDAVDRSLDHVIPIARGGTHEYNNVQLAHLRCNKSKGARLTGQGVM